MPNLRDSYSQGDLIPEELLAQGSPYQMQRIRAAAPQQYQAQLGPIEHAAFAREGVGANPAMAVPLAAATPLYTAAKFAAQQPDLMRAAMPFGLGGIMSEAAKALGYDQSRSPPTLNEIGQGYKGIFQGLRDYFGGSKPPGESPEVEAMIERMKAGQPPVEPKMDTADVMGKKSELAWWERYRNWMDQQSRDQAEYRLRRGWKP